MRFRFARADAADGTSKKAFSMVVGLDDALIADTESRPSVNAGVSASISHCPRTDPSTDAII